MDGGPAPLLMSCATIRPRKGNPMSDNDPFNPNLRRIDRGDLLAARHAPPPSTEPLPPTGSPPIFVPPTNEPCSWCDGAGYYLEAVPYGHPQFGKLLPCHCTQARWQTARTS